MLLILCDLVFFSLLCNLLNMVFLARITTCMKISSSLHMKMSRKDHFLCIGIGKKLTTAWDFLELHSGIKQEVISELDKNRSFHPYKCQLCDYATFVPGALTQHMLTHCIERPYKCPVCLKGFTQKGSVQMHMVHHTGERPHKCPVCGRRYSQKGSMRRHIIQHLDGDSSKCPLCSETIKERLDMETHLIQHTKKDSFYCFKCDATFPNSETLKDHNKRHHWPKQIDA